MTTTSIQGVDHVIFAAPDLDLGMDEIERLLGTRPCLGGRHPDYGTHNALLSLGPTSYLEIIAPDPGVASPALGLPFGLLGLEAPRLTTWALRTEAIESLHERAAAEEIDLGALLSGHRRNPDGEVLRWQVSDPQAGRLDGALPFLISWGATPHPASANPSGGELVALRVEHPDPARVRQALRVLGAELEVTGSASVGLAATLRTDRGEVVLR